MAALLQSNVAARPSLLLEQRAAFELTHLITTPVFYGAGVPRGDGSHILLIPGFMGSDGYMSVLSGWLQRIGYRPHASGLYLNAGRPFDLLGHLLRRVEEVAAQARRRITIVGHSLGGIFGRVLARLRPDAVAHAVALGSPLTNDPRRAGHPFVRAMAEMLLREGPSESDRLAQRMLEQELMTGPLPDTVRLTSVYSRDDAVVDWHACVDDDPVATCHEVRGSHVGLAWNAQVYRCLGHALLQPL
jgi:pimeloyl-ACP methyl ester carboxylesterase